MMATEEGQVNIEIPNEDTLIGFYYSLPKSSDILRLFDHGNFYTIHGENAEEFARSFLNTVQAIRYLGTDNCRLASVSISSARYEPFLRHVLIDNNYRVEIYKGTSKGGTSKGKDWNLEIKASPGCLGKLEDVLYSSSVPVLNQHVSAIYVGSSDSERVYLVSINVFDCTIHFGSFEDNTSYTTLESLIVRFSPKECLLPVNFCKERIKKILSKNNILYSEYKPSKERTEDIESILQKLLKEEFKILAGKFAEASKRALIPFLALIEYLNLLNDRYCYSNYHLKSLEIDAFVRLDLSSITNLHLFANSRNNSATFIDGNGGGGGGKKIESLFQVLNHCKSISGKKLLDKYIRQPLTSLPLIEQRLDCVEFFRENPIVHSSFCDHFLDKIPDMSKTYKKFTSARIKLGDVYQVYNVVEMLPNMRSLFESVQISNSVQISILDQLKQAEDDLEPFRELTQKTLDLERYQQTRELWIKAEIDDELLQVKKKIDDLNEKAELEYSTVKKDLRRSADIESNAVQFECDKAGFYFRVTKQYAPAVIKQKKYIEISSGKVKECKFVNEKLEDINHDFLEFSSEYDRLQQRFVSEFLDEIRPFMDAILRLENILSYIDVMASFAKASQQTIRHYQRPKLLPKGSGRIVLKEFRHPIIELLSEMDYVSNDVSMDEKQSKMFVITGANMGGKSTLIRSVALSVLLAQIGSFVPCDEAEISIVDAIYTRISASDCPQLGLSTFMAEMVESSAIIRSATENSLVVIDELGRSTGTFDGFGLAQGISEHLANNVKAYTLFATHFHHLAKNIPTIGRLAMKSSCEEGLFHNHYRAEIGTAEKSFGIELAKEAQMPENIIVNAAIKLSELEKLLSNDAFEKVIALLEKKVDISNAKEHDLLSDDHNGNLEGHSKESNLKEQVKQKIRQEILNIDWKQF